ncbi:MAG: glutathione peroxidase [Pirellulales bacterium]
MNQLYEIEVTGIDGGTQRLADYRGQVLLVVNVASRCALTPQYAELEALYRTYRDQGFVILGFPCDQFRHQEPGDEAQIKNFCKLTYDVTFPLFAKIGVNGPATHPLYQYLKSARPGILGSKSIKWNFTKFLIDRQGTAVHRYAPQSRARSLERGIRKLLVDCAIATPSDPAGD